TFVRSPDVAPRFVPRTNSVPTFGTACGAYAAVVVRVVLCPLPAGVTSVSRPPYWLLTLLIDSAPITSFTGADAFPIRVALPPTRLRVTFPIRLLFTAAELSRISSPPPIENTAEAWARDPFGPDRIRRPAPCAAAAAVARIVGVDSPSWN